MLLALQNKSSLWSSLLWKDFQQVKLAFLVLVGGAFCMQLLFFAIVWSMRDLEQWEPLVNSVFGLASVTPILLALGCSGMLVGHERQAGSWAWSSSLPVSWWQALGSKLIVTMLGSLVVSLPLGFLPAFLSTSPKFHAAFGDVNVAYFSLTLVIFLQVIVVCFLTTVLMRETLGALFVAGVVLILLHVFSSLPWWYQNHWTTWIANRFGVNSDSVPAFWLLFLSASILAIGCGLLVVAFRWRWTYGQQSKLVLWPVRLSAFAMSEFQYRTISSERPSDWWTMFVLSFRNNFAMGICILATMTVCLFGFLKTELTLLVMFVLAAMLVLGVITFQSDQTSGRIRFLADRGIAPWKLVLSRLSISLGIAIPVYLAYSFALSFHYDPNSFHLSTGVILGLTAFSIGSLASLCFRKPVVILGVAIIVAIFGLMANLMLNLLVTFDRQVLISNYQSHFDTILLSCQPAGTLIYVASLFWLSRRWLVQDKPNLELHFLWISFLALLSPFCIACTFGFLTIPNIPDIARPIAANSTSTPTVPDYLSVKEPLFIDTLLDLELLSRRQSGSMNVIANSAHNAISTVRNELRARADQTLNEQVQLSLTQLDEIHTEERVRATVELKNQLESLIVRTAALATIALKDMNGELGLRLWKMNRELQNIGGEVYPQATHAARNTAMYLLLELGSSDVQSIGGPEVYRSLIPDVPDEQTPSIEESYFRERQYRQLLHANNATTPVHWFAITQYYPPMRWLYERQLSSDHRRERAYLASAPKNHITDMVRSQLVQRFPE